MAVVALKRPDLTFFERLIFPGVFRGLSVTIRHLFRRKVTLSFPEQRHVFPEGYRGFPRLVSGPDGVELCVACKLCEAVCPPDAITIRIGEYPYPEQRERVPSEFVIDMGRCIVCGMCEEACPVDAIVMSDTHIVSSGSRESLIFRKFLLLDDYRRIPSMRP